MFSACDRVFGKADGAAFLGKEGKEDHAARGAATALKADGHPCTRLLAILHNDSREDGNIVLMAVLPPAGSFLCNPAGQRLCVRALKGL